MKCESLACIWSPSPPLHRVTSATLLQEPPTLYTGGSDGSIIWWNLDSSLEKPELTPIAVLCGHSAPIADLAICFPFETSGKQKSAKVINSPLYPNVVNCGALISVCRDGVLCVWSRTSGHCRRRSKIPSWAGSPSIIRPLFENKRYVCIACSSVKHERQPLNSVEGESEDTDFSRCAVLIFDSFTLALVQTVFHGNLPTSPLKSMEVVLDAQDAEKQLVMIVDYFGKLLYLPIRIDYDSKGQNDSLTKGSSIMELRDYMDEKGSLVAFSMFRYILAFVYATHCTFRDAGNGNVLGKIFFSDYRFFSEDKSYIKGGIFLENYAGISNNSFLIEFLVWDSRGAAILFRISSSSDSFEYDALYSIRPSSHPSDITQSFSFVSLNKYLLRVESVCFSVEEHVSWRPSVSMWFLPQPSDNIRKLLDCCVIKECNLFDIWGKQSTLTAKIAEKGTVMCDEVKTNVLSLGEHDGESSTARKHAIFEGSQLVSSSMVISESYLSPYAVVYGFFNGDIELVRFQSFFTASDYSGECKDDEADSCRQKQRLCGHKGAVLCFASQLMVPGPVGSGINHVLISGGTDCTVRVWDIDSGNPLTVLHQHVAPVRKIIVSPSECDNPWRNCFLTVGDDLCVALASLQTLSVERLFPGHLYYPSEILWDGRRGYLACLCRSHYDKPDSQDILYIWDVKSGARERVLYGAPAQSMFDRFVKASSESTSSWTNKGTSFVEPTISSQSQAEDSGKGTSPLMSSATKSEKRMPTTSNAIKEMSTSESSILMSRVFQREKHPIRSSSPFPGVSTLCFDLNSLMSLCSVGKFFEDVGHIGQNTSQGGATPCTTTDSCQICNVPLDCPLNGNHCSVSSDDSNIIKSDHHESVHYREECLLQFSLSFLHLWNVDAELDNLLITEMKLKPPNSFVISSGILGDKGSMTLAFPGSSPMLKLWRSSSEYSALRSLTMVSLAQQLISLSHLFSSASSALAAFYNRKLLEKIPDIKPPHLQLLVSFWQNEFEHVRMAARSLFHCSASWSIPRLLCSSSAYHHVNFHSYPSEMSDKGNDNASEKFETLDDFVDEESEITSWLDSYEKQDWISCIGGTTQDAMASQIIVAAALAVWYPSLVKSRLANMVIHPLVKLVMAMNEKYSGAAAEILAEGMENTWKTCLDSEIPRLIGDIFFQVECVSSASRNVSSKNSFNMNGTLVGILLPSLAMADSSGFLHVIERQIWSTASYSPVHVVSLMTLIRVVRGSPKNLSPYLDKVITFILQTMDPSNSTMRKSCLQFSMTALKEVVRVFPMVALNDASTRLAVGDAIGEVNTASIRVYDMHSMSKIKVLDASGPPGLPGLLGKSIEATIMTAISALSFSPDGEGLVAFSENGLMIRWWSLGSVWWEKLSQNLVAVQCTKLIFVPPWEGFSPSFIRSSIMATADGKASYSPGSARASNEMDRLKQLVQNLDLSYRLEWIGERKIKLLQHAHELDTLQL